MEHRRDDELPRWNHDEILRLREWKHQAEGELLAHGWRLNALDEWRRRVDRELAELHTQVAGMISADTIADAVAARVRDDRRNLLTWPRKLAAAVAGVALLGCTVVQTVLLVRGAR